MATLQRPTGGHHRASRSRQERDISQSRVDAVTKRPLDRFPIMNVDIVIDNDHMLGGVIAEVTAPECRGDLLGVTAMRFANLYTHRFRPFATPYTGNIGHAGLLQIVPRHR